MAGRAAAAGLVSSKVTVLIEQVLRSMLLTKFTAVPVGVLLLALVATGLLSSGPPQAERPTAVPNAAEEKGDGAAPVRFPSVVPLIEYLNDNANRIQGLLCSDMHLTRTRNGDSSIGLNCMMALQKPGNIRFRGTSLGNKIVDIGANEHEFWWWGSKAQPPLVHCSFKDLPKLRNMPFPFHPQWIMEVMGMGPYGPSERFQLEYDSETIKLIEAPSSSQGLKVRKVIVCRRQAVQVPQPQVLAYLLLDDRSGVEICSAHVQKVAVHRGAIVPTRFEIRWPAEKVTLSLQLDTVFVNAKFNEGVFFRSEMPGVPAFDLGSNQFDDVKPGNRQQE